MNRILSLYKEEAVRSIRSIYGTSDVMQDLRKQPYALLAYVALLLIAWGFFSICFRWTGSLAFGDGAVSAAAWTIVLFMRLLLGILRFATIFFLVGFLFVIVAHGLWLVVELLIMAPARSLRVAFPADWPRLSNLVRIWKGEAVVLSGKSFRLPSRTEDRLLTVIAVPGGVIGAILGFKDGYGDGGAIGQAFLFGVAGAIVGLFCGSLIATSFEFLWERLLYSFRLLFGVYRRYRRSLSQERSA